jgi:hypothetical protein
MEMPPRSLRRHGLAAALLVLSLLALVIAPLVPHEGHGCYFEKGCLACRWAADAVADTAAPVVLPHPIAPVAVVATKPPASVANTSPEAASPRGPPLT